MELNNPASKKEEKKDGSEEGFDLSKIYVWIKGLESKQNNLRRELDVLKTDFAQKQDKQSKGLKIIEEEVLELKREQQKTAEKMDLIIKELKLTAGREEVMVIKKYLDLWNPMNFVTQRDIERLLEQKKEEWETKNRQ